MYVCTYVCFRSVGLPADADAGRGVPPDAGDPPAPVQPRQQCHRQDTCQVPHLIQPPHRYSTAKTIFFLLLVKYLQNYY